MFCPSWKVQILKLWMTSDGIWTWQLNQNHTTQTKARLQIHEKACHDDIHNLLLEQHLRYENKEVESQIRSLLLLCLHKTESTWIVKLVLEKLVD